MIYLDFKFEAIKNALQAHLHDILCTIIITQQVSKLNLTHSTMLFKCIDA